MMSSSVFAMLLLLPTRTEGFMSSSSRVVGVERGPCRRFVAESFDFSSKAAWDDYYKRQATNAVTEWHSSVPMDILASLVPSDASLCVIIGCGPSLLPQWIQKYRPKTHLILQDSSESCLEMLRDRYGSSVSFACGDATKLSAYIQDKSSVIYDKGLMDAIFCNEGWNTPIRLLLEESAKVLKEGGLYILVSYRLSQSTKDFLVEIGKQNNLSWRFDMAGSNDRVGISIARKGPIPCSLLDC